MKMGPQDTVWITGAAGRMGQAIEHFLDHSRYKVMTSDIEIDVSNLHEVVELRRVVPTRLRHQLRGACQPHRG